MPSTEGPRVACIDIGSNGIRMVAARCGAGEPQTLAQERASVRMGRSVFLHGTLDEPTMDAALDALREFRVALARLEPLKLRAVATSAVREARNRKAFLRRARQEAGVAVEVISGAEEARLVHLAVARRIPLDGQPWMLVDVGGGSVEVSLGDGEGLHWTHSRSMGAVRLLEHFSEAASAPRRQRRIIQEAIGALRVPALPPGGCAGLVATGGNMEELAEICADRRPQGRGGAGRVDVVQADRLRALIAEMQEMEPDQRARKWGLKKDRADVILPAAMVYEQVARLAGAKAIHVPHVALKDGVLAELADGLSKASALERRSHRSAVSLGRRFGFDEAHGLQVERLAASLFDQLQEVHKLGARDRAVLSAAAILHDIGRHVADRRHHKHSQYLISQSEVLGLSRAEVRLAAVVARYHRKAEPKPRHDGYRELDDADRSRVDRMAALLRVADALDRQHKDNVRAVRCVRDGPRLRLELDARDDILLEEWAVGKKGGWMEKVFGLKVELHEGKESRDGKDGKDARDGKNGGKGDA